MSQDLVQFPGYGAEVEKPAVKAVAVTGDAARSGGALRLGGINLSFGGVQALSGVDLDVVPGEIRSIIGPNGAGKSSLINVISGIYRPDSGTIHLAGKDFRRVPTAKLARFGVSRTFQNLALFKGLSVLENVKIGRPAHGGASLVEQFLGIGRARRENAESSARADALIDFLDLGSVRDRLAGTLSYGLQKRVELARALVARPRILLLDEPMAGMTPVDKEEMARFIRSARDEFGTTVILIEHDIGVVMGLSDRIAVLDYGRKIADGIPSEIRADQAVIDAYMGVIHGEDRSEEETP